MFRTSGSFAYSAGPGTEKDLFMLDYLKIGGIISTHGLKGEVKVFPTTEDVRRYDDLDTVYIEMPQGRLPVHVEHVRYFKNLVIVKFRGLNRIEDVQPYLKHDLYVSREDAIELKENEYFVGDVIGLKTITDDGRILEADENRSPQTVGVVVDYLTRFMIFHDASEAFKISAEGAMRKEMMTDSNGKELVRFTELIQGVTGLDDKSIINACLLSEYDVWKRNLSAAMSITDYESVIPDKKTINNIRTMVERSVDFFNINPIIKDGFTFEPDGYSAVVTSGDGDFLSKDTLWDFKVSKHDPSTDNTLQILMYYIMGKHSGNHLYDEIDKIGIFNPRLNKAYLYDMNNYSKELYEEIERDVICYNN